MYHHRLLLLSPIIARPLSSLSFCAPTSRASTSSKSNFATRAMVSESLCPSMRGRVNFRVCSVFSFMTELLEVHSDKPTLHILLIPGNPGVVTYYRTFVESLYLLLGENVSVTAIGHISHTEKDYEQGRTFTLRDQIDHKMDFIRQEMKDTEVPILLIGHSIGSYISLEMFKRSPEKVLYCIGLYPFLTINQQSSAQSRIRMIAASSFLSGTVSFIVASLGLLGSCGASKYLVTNTIGKSWSDVAVRATCSHLLKYHTMRNVLFMAMTEFEKLTEPPDWAFMKENHEKITFLFGVDDHWGPLQLHEEISQKVPDIALSIEEEGHTHAFSCTEAGSLWVARHVSVFLKKKIPRLRQERNTSCSPLIYN